MPTSLTWLCLTLALVHYAPAIQASSPVLKDAPPSGPLLLLLPLPGPVYEPLEVLFLDVFAGRVIRIDVDDLADFDPDLFVDSLIRE